MSNQDYQKQVGKLNRLRALGVISFLEWRDELRKLLMMIRPADNARVTGLTR